MSGTDIHDGGALIQVLRQARHPRLVPVRDHETCVRLRLRCVLPEVIGRGKHAVVGAGIQRIDGAASCLWCQGPVDRVRMDFRRDITTLNVRLGLRL